MTYRGRIKNGVVVLDPPVNLPDGVEVDVSPTETETEPPTWAEVFKNVIGKADGLPTDSAVNHDHYLYGAPKK
jgi:hypothetical protein